MTRIEPAKPPYPEAVQKTLERVMPAGVPSLVLFTTLARSERAFSRFMAAGLIDNGPIKDPAVYERIGPTYVTELNGRVSLESLAEEQEFYLKHGFITTRLDPPRMVDTSFGDDAMRILGRVGD